MTSSSRQRCLEAGGIAGMILISYQNSIKMIMNEIKKKHTFCSDLKLWKVWFVPTNTGFFINSASLEGIWHMEEGGIWLLSVTETPLHTFKIVLCISRFSMCESHWLMILQQHLATPGDNSICRRKHAWFSFARSDAWNLIIRKLISWALHDQNDFVNRVNKEN